MTEDDPFEIQADQPDVKKKLVFRDPPELPLEKHILKIKRRLRMHAYQIKDDGDIIQCLACGKSNLKIEEKTCSTNLQYKFNQCSVCEGLAIHSKSGNHGNLWNIDTSQTDTSPERFAYCVDCLEIREPENLEYERSELTVEDKFEIKADVIFRRVEKNLIDQHHLQYADRHGREITIPLCKECHNEEQRGNIPELSPENIGEKEHIVSTVFD